MSCVGRPRAPHATSDGTAPDGHPGVGANAKLRSASDPDVPVQADGRLGHSGVEWMVNPCPIDARPTADEVSIDEQWSSAGAVATSTRALQAAGRGTRDPRRRRQQQAVHEFRGDFCGASRAGSRTGSATAEQLPRFADRR